MSITDPAQLQIIWFLGSVTSNGSVLTVKSDVILLTFLRNAGRRERQYRKSRIGKQDQSLGKMLKATVEVELKSGDCADSGL